MKGNTTPSAIAARICGLIGRQQDEKIEATAKHLGVSDVALRISIDDDDPHPAVEVIAAIVKYHGVDPTWLLTGEYDLATHRAAADEDATGIHVVFGDLLARQLTPKSSRAIGDSADQLEA